MGTYSPIESIHIKNFRNLGDVEIDFKESPIISLVGENESGKTSIVKAFSVCAAHTDPRSQKDYIRDGTNGFGVVITLQDGTVVTRIKLANSNRYLVTNPDKSVALDLQKLENEVPKEVQRVMGIVEEPETRELLHIRTYEDQLLFVTTPASTNYKVMYDALKVSQITQAIKIGNTEANELKRKINESGTSIETLHKSLAAIKVTDINPLLNVRTRLDFESKVIDRLSSIIALSEDNKVLENTLGAFAELLNQPEISLSEASLISRMEQAMEIEAQLDSESQRYEVLKALESLDTEVNLLSKLSRACSLKLSVDQEKSQLSTLMQVTSLSQLDVSDISSLENIVNRNREILLLENYQIVYSTTSEAKEISAAELSSLTRLSNLGAYEESIKAQQTELATLQNYIYQIENWFKQIGVATTTCTNCGETVVIDLDALEGREMQ